MLEFSAAHGELMWRDDRGGMCFLLTTIGGLPRSDRACGEGHASFQRLKATLELLVDPPGPIAVIVAR
jgi:hypothetical protein